jgi:urease accessory protein
VTFSSAKELTTVQADSILGDIDDPAFAGRLRHTVTIGWGDAAKARQLAVSDTGVQVRIRLPRGSFLADGAVIADDGEQVVVVQRPLEPAVTVPFAGNTGVSGARRMLALGYLLGNQHAPIDLTGDAVAAPLFTSAEAAMALLADLGIEGSVRDVALACAGWTRTSGDQKSGHHHHDA